MTVVWADISIDDIINANKAFCRHVEACIAANGGTL